VDGGRYPFEVVGGVPVVAAPEEIDVTNAASLRSAMLAAAPHGHGTLVVDMTLTRFCDSSGLHTLLAAHRRAQAEGGELLLVLAAAAVLRVFALTGVDRLIPTFSTIGEALAQASPGPLSAVSELAGRVEAGLSAQQRPPGAPG
jgi:anti-sigma B factor antagonist